MPQRSHLLLPFLQEDAASMSLAQVNQLFQSDWTFSLAFIHAFGHDWKSSALASMKTRRVSTASSRLCNHEEKSSIEASIKVCFVRVSATYLRLYSWMSGPPSPLAAAIWACLEGIRQGSKCTTRGHSSPFARWMLERIT